MINFDNVTKIYPNQNRAALENVDLAVNKGEFVFLVGTKRNANPSMQYRRLVGGGPSSKRWPRWLPQRRQCTSVRTIMKLVSLPVSTASGSGFQKLGQPVPESNLVFDEYSGNAQPAQW